MTKSIVIVGGGPGGYVSAIRASQLGAKVTLIEKEKSLGGTCLNVGCIPSKALLQFSHFVDLLKHDFPKVGIHAPFEKIDFSQMQKAKGQIVSTLTQGIAYLLKKNNVRHIHGEARFIGHKKLEVNGEVIEGDYIILATGSKPIELPFFPVDEERVLSSTGALALKEIPKHLLIVGAGVIGLEMGSVYHSLGSKVTFIEFLPRICPSFDTDVSQTLTDLFTARGITFHLNTKVTHGEKTSKGVKLTVEEGSKGRFEIEGDYVLQSIGRKPTTHGLDPAKGGIELDEKGFIKTGADLQTSIPGVYAIGDVTYGPMLAHKASHEGIALVETLLGHAASYNLYEVPNVIYTHPEVAHVGLTEEDLKSQSIAYKVGKFPLKANSRGLVEGDDKGFVKVLVDEKTERLMGATILCLHASEMLPMFQLAIHLKLKTAEIKHLMIAHPTLSESLIEAILSADKQSLHF
ncbi:MAG: dihydrolipoyl dehydrogenase [Chlamydiia bacterium]